MLLRESNRQQRQKQPDNSEMCAWEELVANFVGCVSGTSFSRYVAAVFIWNNAINFRGAPIVFLREAGGI